MSMSNADFNKEAKKTPVKVSKTNLDDVSEMVPGESVEEHLNEFGSTYMFLPINISGYPSSYEDIKSKSIEKRIKEVNPELRSLVQYIVDENKEGDFLLGLSNYFSVNSNTVIGNYSALKEKYENLIGEKIFGQEERNFIYPEDIVKKDSLKKLVENEFQELQSITGSKRNEYGLVLDKDSLR